MLTGAQKWLREPASENASVVRCSPAAISRSTTVLTAAGGQRGDAAEVHRHHHGRGAADGTELAHHDSRGLKALAATAQPRRHRQRQNSGRLQGLDLPSREGAGGVDLSCTGSDHLIDDARQCPMESHAATV